jgi:hypothetical protein
LAVTDEFRSDESDSNNSDAEGEIDLDLLPLPGTTGTLRQAALEDVATYVSSGFKITFYEKHVIHGFYDGTKSDPASLLVYEISLTSTKNHRRRIRYLKASLKFEAHPLKQPVHDPFLCSWEPAMRGEVFIHPSKVSYTEEQKNKISATVKKEPIPAEASAEHETTKGKNFDRDDKATCKVDTSRTQTRGGGRKGKDLVTWQLLENKSQELLPDSFGVAVVIKRCPGLNFRVEFSADVEVDFWYDVAVGFNKAKDALFFKGRRDTSKLYDVSEQSEIPSGVEKVNLKELVDRDGLDDFIFFHEPEEIETTKRYGKGPKKIKKCSEVEM